MKQFGYYFLVCKKYPNIKRKCFSRSKNRSLNFPLPNIIFKAFFMNHRKMNVIFLKLMKQLCQKGLS